MPDSTPLREAMQRLQAQCGLRPVTAAEIEFYLHGSERCVALPEFWQQVRQACAEASIPLYKIEKEKGREQHEIALMPVNDPLRTCNDVQTLKTLLAHQSEAAGLQVDFAAKPLADEPGSGLHIHLHLEDGQGKNVFYKDDSRMSDALKHSLGGLLAHLPGDMAIFAPHEASYARFTAGSNAPLTVSWGANNRTVAIRLPDAPHDQKRIEHRVAGADADPYQVMTAILQAVNDGILNRREPGAQIHGDAALPLYALPPLPRSLEEAKKQSKQGRD